MGDRRMSHCESAARPDGEPDEAAETGSMHPVAIDGCFGWLHLPVAGVRADVAVLLCTGVGADGMVAHSQFRQLASNLAAAGYPALRFDYPGAGDSRDPEAGADLWAVWLGSVHKAADWLRNETGAQRLVICGLRLGATLAATVAGERADVAGLALIAPLARGRMFVRQLQIAAMAGGVDLTGELEINGSPASAATVQTIMAVEITNVVLPRGCAVAMYYQAPSPALEECALAWEQSGVVVMRADLSGQEPMLRPSYMCHEPPAEFRHLIAWLCRTVPVTAPRPAGLPAPVIRHSGHEDVPLRFGAGRRLFGMLCRPQGGASDIAVVLLNGGGDPHYGGNRGTVMLARHFAAAGIASLRMDFSGLGDSVTPGDRQTHVFDTDRQAEVSAAIDALAAHGFRRFAVGGICAGAYHAFHAALKDERVATLLLVNLPTFKWRSGTGIEFFAYTQHRPSDIIRHLGGRAFWLALFRRKIDLRNHVLSHLCWLSETASRLRGRLVRAAGLGPRVSVAQAGVARLSGRTRTLLLMSPSEIGLTVLEAEFGRDRGPPGWTFRILPELDHSLNNTAARDLAAGMMTDFLRAGPGGLDVQIEPEPAPVLEAACQA